MSRSLSFEELRLLEELKTCQPANAATLAMRLGRHRPAVGRSLLKWAREGTVKLFKHGTYVLADYEEPSRAADSTPRSKLSGVYVLCCNGLYKIGQSENVNSRVDQLRTALPYEVEHILTIPSADPAVLEASLHARYAERRVRGEWFDLDVFDLDDLCALVSDHELS